MNGLVMAKSLISSSELGALSHSASLASGNSLPMTGVTSKDLNSLRTPLSCNGGLRDAWCVDSRVSFASPWETALPLETASPLVEACSFALPLEAVCVWVSPSVGTALVDSGILGSKVVSSA